MLALASQRSKGDAASLAAQEVTRKVTAAVAEDGSYLLVAQVSRDAWGRGVLLHPIVTLTVVSPLNICLL